MSEEIKITVGDDFRIELTNNGEIEQVIRIVRSGSTEICASAGNRPNLHSELSILLDEECAEALWSWLNDDGGSWDGGI